MGLESGILSEQRTLRGSTLVGFQFVDGRDFLRSFNEPEVQDEGLRLEYGIQIHQGWG